MNWFSRLMGFSSRRSDPASPARSSIPRRHLPKLQLHASAYEHPGAVYKKGEWIGNTYEVFGVLGVGGFSVVYLVYSHETESVYALKTLRDEFLKDKETRVQFRKEAKVWVDLEHHPYLVRANFIEELAGRLYIGMEYIEPNEAGLNSVEGYLQRQPPDLLQALRWSIQICHGMEYAHERGIRCHRDVKPANLMITRDMIAKITDFGFADVIEASRVRTAADSLLKRKAAAEGLSGFGTPMYMPPEQFRNAARCDERSDIYSFGVVLYQMAAGGKLPFSSLSRMNELAGDAPTLWKEMHRLHTTATVAPLASPLFPIIQRCLQKEPSARYQTFKEMRPDLDMLLAQQGGEAVEARQPKELEAWELYNKAFSLSSLGHLDEAIQYYEKVLAVEPRNTDAWNNMGACYRKLGRLEDALRCFDSSVKADTYNTAAWSNRGNLLYTLNRYTEAMVSLNKALENDPLNEFAWLNKGMVEERLGLRKEAVTSFKKFIDLKPVQHAAHLPYVRRRLEELEKQP